MIYSWQEPYISTLLESDDLKRRYQILETRAAFEQRLLSPVGDDELRAMGVAATVLDALERERMETASKIRNKRASSRRGNRGPRKNPRLDI
jgi:hypothetical protein